MKNLTILTTAALIIIMGLTPALVRSQDDVPRIGKDELKKLLNDSGIILIDVRYTPNWKKSGQKVAGAVREDPNDISTWVGKYKKDQRLVLY
jgi:hypothetical protein